jgi:O-antigen/teichoic acid export membrane protein
VFEASPQRWRQVHHWPIARPLLQQVRSNPDRYLSLVDQGLVALCRFVAIVVFARALSHDEFGVVSLAISISILFVGFARASFTLPFAAFCADHRQLTDDGARWFAFSLFLVAISVVLPLVAAMLLFVGGGPAWLMHTAIYSVALAPATLLYEMSRRWLFQLHRYRSLILQGVVCAAVSVLGFGGVWVLRHTWVAVLALVLAYFVASSVALSGNLPHARLRFSDIAGVWREIRHFARWTIVECIADSVQNYGMNLAVAFFGGPASASVFATTRNVVAPVYTLTSALGAEIPRLARSYAASGSLGLTKALRSTQAFMLMVSVPYLLMVVCFSEPLLRLCYGSKYVGFVPELRLWALSALLLAIIRPLDMWLIASLNSRTLFLRKVLGAFVTVLVAVFLLPTQGVEGALYAIAAGMTLNMLGLLLAVYWRSSQRILPGAPVS